MASQAFKGVRVLLPEWKVLMVRSQKSRPANEAVFRIQPSYVSASQLLPPAFLAAGHLPRPTLLHPSFQVGWALARCVLVVG
jgi:hypothetical protein